MSTIKRIVTMFMFGFFIAGGTLHAGYEKQNEVFASILANTDTFNPATEMEIDTQGETQSESTLAQNEPKGINPWFYRIPLIAAVLATGGLAAVPLLTGAVSAEVAMGAALALAVL